MFEFRHRNQLRNNSNAIKGRKKVEDTYYEDPDNPVTATTAPNVYPTSGNTTSSLWPSPAKSQSGEYEAVTMEL